MGTHARLNTLTNTSRDTYINFFGREVSINFLTQNRPEELILKFDGNSLKNTGIKRMIKSKKS